MTRVAVLDDEKRSSVCSLIAAGVSLRQAALSVECDPQSIRREAQRNDEFRRQLAEAKSKAMTNPLLTLSGAARSDWRAAICLMERLKPERYARQNSDIITKREANRFVDDLVESIERAVSNPGDRQNLFELLATAMPAAMHRRWEAAARGRAMERVTQEFEIRKSEEERNLLVEEAKRDRRRRDLLHRLGDYLTPDLYRVLADNQDLLDPEKFLRVACKIGKRVVPHNDERTSGSPPNDDATSAESKKDGSDISVLMEFKTGTIGAQKYYPPVDEKTGKILWDKFERRNPPVRDGRSTNASPGDDNASPTEDNASS